LDAIEIKSGATVVPEFFRNLQRFAERLSDVTPARKVNGCLVYGGAASQRRTQALVLSWREVARVLPG